MTSRGTARQIAWRIRNQVKPEPVFAGETRRVAGDDVWISSVERGGMKL